MKNQYEKELVCVSLNGAKTILRISPNGLSAILDEIDSEKAEHWIWKIEQISV